MQLIQVVSYQWIDFYITFRPINSCNMKDLTLLQRYELQVMRNNGSTPSEIAHHLYHNN